MPISLNVIIAPEVTATDTTDNNAADMNIVSADDNTDGVDVHTDSDHCDMSNTDFIHIIVIVCHAGRRFSQLRTKQLIIG